MPAAPDFSADFNADFGLQPAFLFLIGGYDLALTNAAPVTPSDSTSLPGGSTWLSFVNNGAQTLQITTVGGQVVPGIILPSGMWPIRAQKVWASGTTVTNVVAYWD
jgi:hypothetical protein